MARRRNLRWPLASSSGKHVLTATSSFCSSPLLIFLTTMFIIHTTLLHLSPLKDALNLSKTSLISSRNLSHGLVIVDVLSMTAPPGVQHHFKHDVYVSVLEDRRDCEGK